jgi:hypothetical protein
MSSGVINRSCPGPLTRSDEVLMWLLIATMLVMGHHHKVHVELFDTQQACEDRKRTVLETAKKYNAVIIVTCETNA